MKRIILFTVIYCLIFLKAFTQTNEEFLMLYKNENIKEITVTKRNLNEQEKSITVKLNENQKSEFLNRLKHAKKEKYIKALLLYKAEIYYIDDKTEEIWLNGKVIKKEDGTTYKLENNLQLFINSLFSKEDTSKLYKEKIIKTENRNIHVYQANYSRNDLIFISGITSDINSPKTYDCTWKVGQELLDVQNSSLKKKHLKDYIKNEKLQELADLYIKDVYNPSWKNEIPLFYSHYELHPLDEQNNK
ncbi:hypothetical protein [Treponema pedis]|uniref:Uncharacterized protein n=1 Tax=Treponema pedis str. T A4 TaxID=1291379 RepID=S5ZKS1_9SPIR|nr:hypothetical protein [Treponema pedis]AGT43152.1 hypothetical protein TPE_0656 [Treponema pedis str. T A4]QSI03995.1 hypothetical protein DYQ05_03180 [Treponema pedis]